MTAMTLLSSYPFRWWRRYVLAPRQYAVLCHSCWPMYSGWRHSHSCRTKATWRMYACYILDYHNSSNPPMIPIQVEPWMDAWQENQRLHEATISLRRSSGYRDSMFDDLQAPLILPLCRYWRVILVAISFTLSALCTQAATRRRSIVSWSQLTIPVSKLPSRMKFDTL